MQKTHFKATQQPTRSVFEPINLKPDIPLNAPIRKEGTQTQPKLMPKKTLYKTVTQPSTNQSGKPIEKSGLANAPPRNHPPKLEKRVSSSNFPIDSDLPPNIQEPAFHDPPKPRPPPKTTKFIQVKVKEGTPDKKKPKSRPEKQSSMILPENLLSGLLEEESSARETSTETITTEEPTPAPRSKKRRSRARSKLLKSTSETEKEEKESPTELEAQASVYSFFDSFSREDLYEPPSPQPPPPKDPPVSINHDLLVKKRPSFLGKLQMDSEPSADEKKSGKHERPALPKFKTPQKVPFLLIFMKVLAK
jgi:hypothetical protein